MSYDTSIVVYRQRGDASACFERGRGFDPDEWIWDEVEDLGNMTANVSAMYRAAGLAVPSLEGGGKYNGYLPPRSGGTYTGLPGISGLTCADALPHIEAALHYMRTHPAEMIELEPSNGWGSYDGALRYLTKIAEACRRHADNPHAVIGVNW